MTEEVLSNQAFHQWKQNDCTIALFKLIEKAIEIGEKSIIEYVKGSNNIDVNRLTFYKGNLATCYELQQAMLNKESLETEVEDEVE